MNQHEKLSFRFAMGLWYGTGSWQNQESSRVVIPLFSYLIPQTQSCLVVFFIKRFNR